MLLIWSAKDLMERKQKIQLGVVVAAALLIPLQCHKGRNTIQLSALNPPLENVTGRVAPRRVAEVSDISALHNHEFEEINLAAAKPAAGDSTAISNPSPSSSLTYKELKDKPVGVISVGLEAGLNSVLPEVRVLIPVTNHWVVGGRFAAANNISGPKASLAGGGLSVAYYFERLFRAFSAALDLNFYVVDAENAYRKSHATPGEINATVGWTNELAEHVLVNVSGGAQYVTNWNRNIQDIRLNGMSPLIRITIGLEF